MKSLTREISGAVGVIRGVGLAAMFGAIAFAVAAATIAFSRDETTVAAVWPANAITLALLLGRPRTDWLKALLGAYAGFFSANMALGNGLIIAAFCSAANIVEIVICAAALHFRNAPDFSAGRIEDYLRLLAGGMIGVAVSGAIATVAITIAADGDAVPAYASWFVADLLGLMLYTPIVAVLATGNVRRMILGERSLFVAALVWSFVAAASVAIFLQRQVDLLAISPLLMILCAFVFEPPSVALAIAATSMLAIASTAAGLGPDEISSGAMTARLHYLQAFLALLVVAGMPTAIALSNFRRLERTLKTKHAEAVAARDALVEANSRAEAASRAKSAFLANMSHEIRTPLNGVIGFADALAATPLTQSQRAMVKLISTSGESLNALMTDILDLARIEEGRLTVAKECFNLVETVRSASELYRARAEENGLRFVVAIDDTAQGAFYGDAQRLRQVVVNLVSNAVKFTHAGEILIHLQVEDLETAAAARLRVEDTGVGFDAETKSRLFQRFEQADATVTRRHGGSGLGLAIARSLLELMGGRIDVASSPGVGSVFEASFPLERAPTLEIPAPAATPRTSVGSGLRVLVAEDHPINCEVIRTILEPHAIDLVFAKNGSEAVEAFKAQSFDVVLMDLQMPILDGFAATRAIRTIERERGESARTPIAALSANAMHDHVRRAIDAGCDAHIAKPISAQVLLQQIMAWRDAGARVSDPPTFAA